MVDTGAPRRIGLRQPVRGEIRSERGRRGDGAVRILVVLEETGDRAREREPRAVECVHETWLLTLGAAVPDVGTPGLKIEEVAARRDLEPGAHAGRPRLEVVRLGAREARIPRGKQLDPVGQP